MRSALLSPTALARKVPVLQPLSLPYDGKRVFEQSSAGTRIGQLRDRTGGSSIIITSVVDATGATTTNELAVTNDGVLVCGSTPFTWSWTNFWRRVTFREILGPQQRDTSLYISILQLGYAGPGAFNDNFDGTDGPVRLRTGWTTTTESGTNANQDQVGTAGGILAYVTASNGTNVTQVSYEVGTPNLAVQFNAVGAFSATTNSCPRIYLKYVTSSTHNLYFYVSSTNSITFGGRANQISLPTTTYSVTTHPDNQGGLKNGDLVRVEMIGGKLFLYVRGTLATSFTYDVTAFPSSVPNRVMFSSANGGISTAFGYDNLSITPLSKFAVDTMVQPVFYRDKSGFGCVPVSGQVPATGTPNSLVWRLKTGPNAAVPNTLVPGYDWQPLNAIIDSNTGIPIFRAFPKVPGGGNYVIEIADAADTNVVLSTTPFGVGIIWLGYGQSNMANMRDYTHIGSTDLYASQKIAWTITYQPTQDKAILKALGGQQPMTGVSNELIAATGLPTFVINYAKGNQTMLNLSPGVGTAGAGTNLFEQMRDCVLRFGGSISSFNVNQGEFEAAGNPSITGWSDGWMGTETELLAVTAHTPGEYPAFWSYIKGRTDNTANTGSATGPTGHLTMRQCLERLVTLKSYYILSHHPMDCDYQANDADANGAQNIHISADHYFNKLTRRFARNLLRWMGFSFPSQLGPLVYAVLPTSTTTTRLMVDLNGADSLTQDSPTLTGYQIVSGTSFGSKVVSDLKNISSVTLGNAGSDWYIDLVHDAIANGQRCVRYPASTFLKADNVNYVFDGELMFGGTYDGLPHVADNQIRGVYAGGAYTIGLCVCIEKASL